MYILFLIMFDSFYSQFIMKLMFLYSSLIFDRCKFAILLFGFLKNITCR